MVEDWAYKDKLPIIFKTALENTFSFVGAGISPNQDFQCFAFTRELTSIAKQPKHVCFEGKYFESPKANFHFFFQPTFSDNNTRLTISLPLSAKKRTYHSFYSFLETRQMRNRFVRV